MYLDPPYVKENKKSFVSYVKNGFSNNFHTTLFKLLQENKKKFILSNSNSEYVRINFPKEYYNVEEISCKRSINSKNPGSKTKEVLISNF